MIELNNVKKVYNSKKGAYTTALNNINLKIGNKGFIFIVGKSGSGKSTLLNLLGGLDNITSGEILFNGKNISNFTKKEYDAYRNSCVGFVFQEFNVLDQYNVYENIELAVKLQNKNISKQEIDVLLHSLGIDNLGNRNINELSGGQKQRVAIARALIKKPQIILADEPTGNLDVNSSSQIFEILKSISKTNLVIVVSHDMESAVKYGDRIIQIEDGNIVNDTNCINEYVYQSYEFKNAKLPLLYALKMALSGFKSKTFKLFMTILLTSISLIFMGITVNFALFDKEMFIVNTMEDNNNYVYNVEKAEFNENGLVKMMTFNDEEIKEIKDIVNAKINTSYSLKDNGNPLNFEFGKNEDNTKYYDYKFYELNFVEVEDDRILGDVIGNIPTKENEIVVHKYFVDYIIKYGIMASDNTLYYPKSYEDLIASKKELKLGDNKVVIVGIINDDDSLYKTAKETGVFEDELYDYFFNNYAFKATNIYVKGFTKNVVLRANKYSILDYTSITNGGPVQNIVYIQNNIKALENELSIITSIGEENVSSLSRNKIILSFESIKKLDKNFDSKFNEFISKQINKPYEEMQKEFLMEYLNNYNTTLKLNFYSKDSIHYSEDINVNVYGISLDGNNYISNEYINEINPVLKEVYTIKVFDNDKNNLTKTFKNLLYPHTFDERKDEPGIYNYYNIDNANKISNVIRIYKGLAKYILIISLVFVLFTFLLFSNFIALSISYCKKEIGTLRALGASTADVIKIFAYESLMVAIISWIISIIGWFVICGILNKSIFGNLYFVLNGIVTHPLIPIIMFIYTVFIALFVTVSSTKRITSIKPIDAILNK